MTHMPPFHLAFPVTSLEAAEAFYAGLLGCAVGRRSKRWIDFDFFGHQITAHLVRKSAPAAQNRVDGDRVAVRHFGAILAWEDWQRLVARLERAGVEFVLAPRLRFEGKAGKQGTFFIADPAGNHLEFKTFRDPAMIFATEKPDGRA